jgi:hypothetical protein
MSSQDSTVADTLAVVTALRRHLKEDHCTHSIRYILRESLKNKSAGLAAQTQQTTDADVITLRFNLHDYANK